MTSLLNFVHSTFVGLPSFTLGAQWVHLPSPFIAKLSCMGDLRGLCLWSQDGAACMSVSVFSHPNSKYCSWEAVVFTGELYHCSRFRATKSGNCTSIEDESVLR